MKSMLVSILCLHSALAVGADTKDAVAPSTSRGGDPWWSHVAYLASDEMEGRFTGTSGYLRAAQYVADRFREYGLEPGGSEGYFHAVDLHGQRVLTAASSMALIADGVASRLDLARDAHLGTRVQQPESVEAPLVFIGYGLHMPEAGYDDFAGQDLRGKILVALSNGGPAHVSDNLKAHARGAELWKAVERSGALGLITIANPKSMDIPWERQTLLAAQEGMFLSDPALRQTVRPSFSASFNPERAQALFERSGRSFAQILALADEKQTLPRFPLNVSLRASVTVSMRQLSAPNVVGILRGSDQALARDYVVLTAHLDHLGIGTETAPDRIYNGAMDNATGVASVLEVARRMSSAEARPKRSVVFIALAAEERGLLGSRAFAERPTVPQAAIAANVNIDMFLPLWPMKSLIVYGAGESTLGADAATVAAEHGYSLAPDPDPNRNSFIRSDQYSFIRTGVPALSLKVGFLRDSAEAKMQKDWLTARYHAPSDDLTQPMNMETAHRFNEYLVALVARIGSGSERPQWLKESFFSRFSRQQTPAVGR